MISILSLIQNTYKDLWGIWGTRGEGEDLVIVNVFTVGEVLNYREISRLKFGTKGGDDGD